MTEDKCNPHDPINKPSWNLIPEGLACKKCPLLLEVVGYDGSTGILEVRCETPHKMGSARIKRHPSYKGGGFVTVGRCLSTDGVHNNT